MTESNADLLTGCENPVYSHSCLTRGREQGRQDCGAHSRKEGAQGRDAGQEFSERIVAIEDIEALATKAARYDAMETALLNGDLFSALQQLNGKHSSESVGVLVDNFLPTLRVLSFEMYCRAIRPVLEDVLLTTHDYARRAGDQNLEQAAHCLHRHLLATEKDRQYAPAPRKAAPRDRKVH